MRKDVKLDINLKLEEQYKRLLDEVLILKKKGVLPKTFRLHLSDISEVTSTIGAEKISELSFAEFQKRLQEIHKNARGK
jgi:hypothetical protein